MLHCTEDFADIDIVLRSPLPNHPEACATTLRRSCQEAPDSGKGVRHVRSALSSRKQVCVSGYIYPVRSLPSPALISLIILDSSA